MKSIKRFVDNIWEAGMHSHTVTAAIIFVGFWSIIIGWAIIIIWPEIAISLLSIAVVARLIYAGLRAR